MRTRVLIVTGLAAAAYAARRSFAIVTVAGTSMHPTYEDRDRILVRRGSRHATSGAVVVFRMPPEHRGSRAADGAELAWLVKRIVATAGDSVPPEIHVVGSEVPAGCLVVRGDNIESLDSRHFGYVPVGDVLGVAVRRLSADSSPGSGPTEPAH